MYLENEQRETGKLNFLTALGTIRGDWLQESLSVPKEKVGQHYFGYGAVDKPVKTAIVGTGNEGCGAMIGQHPASAVEFIAYHDIRPSQIARGRKLFQRAYGKDQGAKVTFHEKWEDLLANDEVEAVVVALPLWLHAKYAIEAMQAGKHVLCEKLMAWSIPQCKEMERVARKAKTKDGKPIVLSVGHQRHYSTLYDNALQLVRAGVLGEIKHVRALWHRNNTWPELDGKTLRDGWSPGIPEEDQKVDFGKYGYKSLEELVRWRLYDRTGGGLMAELGSHQLDAVSLFLSDGDHKAKPSFVNAVGGKYYFEDDRDCEDHVYCQYEFPSGVVLTYSSINTNSNEGYGEILTGTKGTLMIMNERDLMLFKEREPGDKDISAEMHVVAEPKDESEQWLLEWTPSLSLTKEAALAKVALEHASWFEPIAQRPMVSRGYYEEMEAFAYSIRNPEYKVRCGGTRALGDAVMALTTNVAMRKQERIAFHDDWYDPEKEAAPDTGEDVIATV